MKTIGLVGGTGWVSTVEYYRIINQTINERLGGLQAAKCILYSLNFGEVNELKERNDIHGIFVLLKDAAVALAGAGADCILLCANTMHMHADALEKEIQIPLIHIARATADEVIRNGMSKVGLLGTKMTMERDFYRIKLKEQNIEVVVPDADDRDFIERSIFDELLKEDFRPATKQRFLKIIETLKQQGAEGAILGCTEIPLIITQSDCDVRLFNTLEIHARAAVDFALDTV